MAFFGNLINFITGKSSSKGSDDHSASDFVSEAGGVLPDEYGEVVNPDSPMGQYIDRGDEYDRLAEEEAAEYGMSEDAYYGDGIEPDYDTSGEYGSYGTDAGDDDDLFGGGYGDDSSDDSSSGYSSF